MSNLRPQSSPDRLVIGVTGRIGAGKTSAARYLQQDHGFQYVRYSQVLADWLAAEPGPKGRLQEVGWQVMSGGMQEELNRRLVERVPKGHDCAVDGLRHAIDHASLKKEFASAFHLLYIDAPQELRWRRHEHNSRFRTLADFQAADSHPVEQQIDDLRPRADLVVSNTGTLEELYRNVDKYLRRVRTGGRS